jgi:voltage-gated potassium channel
MQEQQDESIGPWQVLILGLSVLVLIAVSVDTVLKLNREMAQILQVFDNIVCAFFIIDFAVRFGKAQSKTEFLRWGWLDLLSSIPVLPYFRLARLVRIVRVLRILRAFRSTKNLVSYLFRNRAQGAFASATLISITLIIFSSIAILNVENDPASNIKNAEDALWWAFATITTVGYGDRYPLTTEGRLIGVVLMLAGVGIFGTFSGYVASWFMSAQKKSS